MLPSLTGRRARNYGPEPRRRKKKAGTLGAITARRRRWSTLVRWSNGLAQNVAHSFHAALEAATKKGQKVSRRQRKAATARHSLRPGPSPSGNQRRLLAP